MIRCEIHLEDYWSAVHEWPREENGRILENTKYLLKTLDEYHVKAEFYVLGMIAEKFPDLIKEIDWYGHTIGSHGYLHFHNESEGDDSDQLTHQILADLKVTCVGYRSPYWYSTKFPGWCGGFAFRALPYFLLKRNILKSGIFFVHPHDIDEQHPHLHNGFVNWKRHFGLKGARSKFEKILKEVSFERTNQETVKSD